MKRTAWIIVIVVIVVIILFIAYKYFNRKPKVNVIVQQPSTTPRQTTVVAPEKNEATSEEKISETENVTETETETVAETENNVVTEKIINASNIPNDALYCASLGYRQQISLLAMNLQQMQGQMDIATINFNNKKNDKNKQNLDIISAKLQKAKEDYLTLYNKCNKK